MPYEVREAIVAPRAVAGVRARVAFGRVGAEFKPYLDQVYAAVYGHWDADPAKLRTDVYYLLKS